MARKRTPALVELPDGSAFVAEIANLTPRSVFVRTSRPLAFGDVVTVTFFSVSVTGAVALLARSPAGALVVFEPAADQRRRIEARMPEIDVLGAEPGASPPPVMRADEEADTTPDLDLATLTRGASARPVGGTARLRASTASQPLVPASGPVRLANLARIPRGRANRG